MSIKIETPLNFTIKRINKGLKHLAHIRQVRHNFTIKRINKGLKHKIMAYPNKDDFTIKRINKGLKLSLSF